MCFDLFLSDVFIRLQACECVSLLLPTIFDHGKEEKENERNGIPEFHYIHLILRKVRPESNPFISVNENINAPCIWIP